MQAKILIIYTGGTIGMIKDPVNGTLKPFEIQSVLNYLPSLKNLDLSLDVFSFDQIIDSSDMEPTYWVKIAETLERNYEAYDGFVVLHGTDTMSYTASALSFMVSNLKKPVVLTGSQLPIGVLRSDGKDNLINALEIAAAKDSEGHAMVPEVSICFENCLYRGNRTTKLSAENFNAFYSGNMAPLAEVGIHVKYHEHLIIQPDWDRPTVFHKVLNDRVGILKLFPGISSKMLESVLSLSGLQALILETYGSGNALSAPWFEQALRTATQRGLIIVNVTQCKSGRVEMGKYAASEALLSAGVISGADITTESALCKLMVLLGRGLEPTEIIGLMQENLCGECQ